MILTATSCVYFVSCIACVMAKQHKKFWEELIAYRIENDTSNNSSTVSCVFVAAVTLLPSSCLATRGKYTYRQTDWLEGFIKYAVQMGLYQVS
jgi:hypothetical protein